MLRVSLQKARIFDSPRTAPAGSLFPGCPFPDRSGGIAFSVWAHGEIEAFKSQFLAINFEELAEHAAKKKSLYTESTFWFDIHYVLFGLLVIGVILLIANAVWKRKLMKEEQALIVQGEEAAV